MLLITRLSVRARTAGHFSKHLIGQLDCATRLDAAEARMGQRDRTRQANPVCPVRVWAHDGAVGRLAACCGCSGLTQGALIPPLTLW